MLIPALGWVSLIGFASLFYYVFEWVPLEANMKFSQKIMYIHLPTILGAYLAFFVVFFCSIGYLWKRTEILDRTAKCSAEIGVVFTGLILVTGSIWGRPTWNAYWVWWDARLITSLMLFLVYLGYLLLRAFADPGEKQARLAAVVGIVAFLDIPLIHVSVRWWRTLHQPSSLFKVGKSGAPEPSLPIEFLLPVIAGLILAVVLYLFLLLYRMRLEARLEMVAAQLARHR